MDQLGYLQGMESAARTYAATIQRLFVAGRGIHLHDAEGVEYIDCLANAGALPLGHNHPEVKAAVLEFLASDAVQQALDLATPAKCQFVRELFSLLPPAFASNAKIHFCGPSGSDAVEAALKLARLFTGRATILAFRGAYHGMTAGALGAMGNVVPKTGNALTSGPVQFAPYPSTYRCPFGTDGSETERLSLSYLRTLLADPESGVPKPAAVIVEPVQGEGGCIPASTQWLRGLRELTSQHDVLLIVDEVQTGLGRTGTMFAFERAGIMPDLLVLSKAIGGGYPIAVLVYDKRLDVWPAGMHAGTFRGNQIAMIAGRATMQIIRAQRLTENAEVMGEQLRASVQRIAARHACLGDVRGRGLMIGAEVVDSRDRAASPAAGALALRIKLNCLQNGLIVETGGRHGAVLRFLPPLIVNEQDVEAIVSRFASAVAAAA
jgi:diaminobutyrate-2-oxoglutarate transaminase